MKYYIIAGEPSGDLHGSNLMRGILKADSEAQFRFWGGDKMAEVGGVENLVKHYKQTSFFGFVQVLRNLRTIFSQIDECKHDIEHFAPDVVVLIDYPGFNMKIAKWAHSKGLQVHYYIAPKAWAWKEHRVKALRKYVDKLLIIFPFEQKWFGDRGVRNITFCGNPLMDAIAERQPTLPSAEAFRERNGLDERPIVALVAGSRVSEIKDNLPEMVALSKRVIDRQFVVTGVEWIAREVYEKIVAGSDVKVVYNQTYDTLNVAEAAIVTSGTATLETALMGIPEMVLYHIPKLYEVLRPLVLKIPFVSLVNINLGREAVREIVVAKVNQDEAERELRSILTGGAKREKMLADFEELRSIIGGAGASERFGAEIVRTIKRK
ncbi:MAG: lipid-A-disaccharide synthase [Alistipes sp.]|nr:lipid-A-disaccharide synthase [Alistipes sp.]